MVASTTSTQDSGLFGHILPMFKAKTGIDVKVVAQGTGQALDTARRGDADVVFVHAKPRKKNFVPKALASSATRDVQRLRPDRPEGRSGRHQGIKGHRCRARAIKAKGADFISRGDKSGTHQAELNLWKVAGIDIAKDKGPWYKEIGQGMGAALNTASASNAYVLADRGTWLSFKNRGELEIAVEGDKRLFNQYGVMLVNPEKHPSVKKDLGQQFIAFWPSGDTSQSMNCWPSSFFTCGCFAGFTSMTPYWLNSRLSPSTTIARSPRFLNESQVPRSAST